MTPPEADDAHSLAMPSDLADVAAAFAQSGVDLRALGLAWARAMPAVAIVPAFGLRALPTPARMVMGLALAASVFPALAPVTESDGAPWPIAVLLAAAQGLPVAIATAVPLWAATMAGGVVDALRGAQQPASAPTVEGGATALGVPLSLLACAIFLATGGPARVVAAIAFGPSPAHPLVAAVEDIAAGIALAVTLGGPLLVAGVIVEIAGALIARAASPAQVHALLAPARTLATLAVMAVVFERLARALAKAVVAAP